MSDSGPGIFERLRLGDERMETIEGRLGVLEDELGGVIRAQNEQGQTLQQLHELATCNDKRVNRMHHITEGAVWMFQMILKVGGAGLAVGTLIVALWHLFS